MTSFPRHDYPMGRHAEGLAALREAVGWALAEDEGPDRILWEMAPSTTLIVAESLTLVDPEALRLETRQAWETAMQAGSALFATTSAAEGTAVTVTINGLERSLPATGPQSCAHAGNWVTSFYLALICRSGEHLDSLARVPVSVLRASDVVFDDFVYSWVETLKSFWCGRQDLRTHLSAAHGVGRPEEARYEVPEVVPQILRPPIDLFHHYLRQDHEEFGLALADALRRHKKYWTATEARAVEADGLVALGPLAVACIARDGGFPIDIESEYLPKALLENLRPGETRTV